ncbi:MAG: DUF3089 domain-containing protein [Bacilli bacterium]|nr:DUF3089 domain-containing protein [Bacilli bacterium]
MKKLLLLLPLMCSLLGCNKTNIYAYDDYWVSQETSDDNEVDTFFLVPTAVTLKRTGNQYNMPLDDENCRNSFRIQVINEMGIYDDKTRFFAPYYSQAVIEAYTDPTLKDKREQYLEIAYQDVKNAFEYYLAHFNNNRPIILAGFSQGADMALRLVHDYFKEKERANSLVACYAIGQLITDDYLTTLSNDIHFANSETDNQCIVGFDCEREDINDTILVPAGQKTNSINPLSWTRDNKIASEELNKGARFFSPKGGEIEKTKTRFDAKIDVTRGTIKVSDVPDTDEFPCSPFDSGVYHVYDWQFYYTNLKNNVETRINHFFNH